MKNLSKFILTCAGLFLCIFLSAQTAPSIEWQKFLGGSLDDESWSIDQNSDHGYIVAGTSYSNDGDVSGHHGATDRYDYWIVRLDSTGGLVWQKSYGGSGNDVVYSVRQAYDGGFIAAGWTSSSNSGDVSGDHSNHDYWILKLDANGNITWQKYLGGTKLDEARSVEQTTDGGYIVAGTAISNDGDVSGNHGSNDFWIVKLDASGNLVWQKCLGGTSADYANSVEQTSDGGFVAAGYIGGSNYYIVKLDSLGNTVWTKEYGGTEADNAQSVQQTADGGYIVAGWSYSKNCDDSLNHGMDDAWILKLNSQGNKVWQNCLGGIKYDYAYSVREMPGGGFVVTGGAGYNSGDVSGNHGHTDVWVFKLDNDGNLVWQKCYGGTDYDEGREIQLTADGGFVVAGYSFSNNFDATQNKGGKDFWIVKLGAEVPANSIITNTISPLTYFQNDPVSVPYTAAGTFNAGNIFTAQLSDAAGSFASPASIGSLTSTTSGTINATIPLTTPAGSSYRIRVVSSNPAVTGSNNGQDITINALTCDVPAGEFTSNITSSSVKTNWSAVATANKYKVRYRITGTNPWTKISATNNYKKLKNLLASTQYDWQVESICSSLGLGNSDWSATQNFTTDPQRLSSEEEISFEVYPNPVSSSATIQFSLTQSSNVSIGLFSVEGREVMMVADENFAEGNHKVNFNRESLAAGIYFLQLKTSSEISTTRLVVE